MAIIQRQLHTTKVHMDSQNWRNRHCDVTSAIQSFLDPRPSNLLLFLRGSISTTAMPSSLQQPHRLMVIARKRNKVPHFPRILDRLGIYAPLNKYVQRCRISFGCTGLVTQFHNIPLGLMHCVASEEWRGILNAALKMAGIFLFQIYSLSWMVIDFWNTSNSKNRF